MLYLFFSCAIGFPLTWATSREAVVVLELKVEPHLTGEGHLVNPGDEFESLTVLPGVIELVGSLVSQVLSVRGTEETVGDILTAAVVSLLHTVGTDVVLRDPVDWAQVGRVSTEVSGPPSDRLVVVSVPHLGALVVVVEPPRLVSDHLVVVVVKELSPSEEGWMFRTAWLYNLSQVNTWRSRHI